MHLYCYLTGGTAYLLDRGKEWCNSERVGPEFFTFAKGGQKKLLTGHHKQMGPVAVKNDSSLMMREILSNSI